MICFSQHAVSITLGALCRLLSESLLLLCSWHRTSRLDVMDPLDFLTEDELLRFFHRKKTEMSCIDQPHTFLTQLRDYDLVSEKLYERVVRSRTKEQKKRGVYEVLDSLERKRPTCVKSFWLCVFTDHILQQYPALRLLRNSLMDGSYAANEGPAEMDGTGAGRGVEGGEDELEGKKVKMKMKMKVKGRQKRKRKGSSPSKRGEEEEEEEEEDQAGPSQGTASVKRRKTPKPTYCSPLRKGGREEVWNWPMYKTQIPVTCGDKKGFLHRQKLAKGEPCILHLEQWYSPGEFERLGGRERSKNWKTSIRCRDTPLLKLIQENHLTSPPHKRKEKEAREVQTDPAHAKKKMRRALFPSSPIICSGDEDSSSNQDGERSEEEQREEEEEEEGGEEEEEGGEERGIEGGEERRIEGGEEEEEGGIEGNSSHDGVDVDSSMFEGTALPVQCGPLIGILQKDRFASGSIGKCIRTEERWLTPTEFIRLNSDLRDGLWRRDITCRGQPLSHLLQRKILQPHSLLCMCRMCSHTEADMEEQRNDDHCFICGERGELLCCDGCPRSFHTNCHLPTDQPDPPDGEWLCTFCIWKHSQEWRYNDHMTLRQVQDSRISDNTLQCQYLLLFLFNADEQRIFTTDPRPSVSDYSSVIPRPMWLQKVRENLQLRYRHVGEFLADIRLIFSNCAVFNRNNPEIREIGCQLRDSFEREFRSTFNIQ
ncbi:hypothetical protein ACEWY4_026452 [Coilia grayii]|uniref:Nuclear body protein SP140-like protein n=1 Tax=Coilia grayii TaxID=363190 RepID=A0ABD1IUX8_9TELE